MVRILNACIEIIPVFPFFLFAFWLSFKHRTSSTARTTTYLLFSLYLAVMYRLVGMPNFFYIRFDPNVNIVPFLYMFSDWENSLLNLILFFPLGAFLPLLWDIFKNPGWTIFYGFGTSLMIELLQLFTRRATDVNDLITNTAGTLVGWLIGRLILVLIPSITPRADRCDLHLIEGITFGIMFFLSPLLSAFLHKMFFR